MRAFKILGKLGAVTIALFFAACSSDSNGGGGGSTPNGTYIKAKIDETSWQTLEISGQSLAIAVSSGTGAGRAITVNGSGDMSGSDSMVINLIGIDATGTYDISPDTNSHLAYVNTATSTSYDTSDCANAIGTVTITTLNETKIEGSFSFVGKVDEDCAQSKTITEGTFRGVFLQN